MNWSDLLRSCAKQVARSLLGDYKIYRIYELDLAGMGDIDFIIPAERGYKCREVSKKDVLAAADEGVRERAFYGGDGALAFAVCWQGEIVCLQWYWFGDRYLQRNFWPLKEREAKSIDLYTVPSHRGQGLATMLKVYAAGEMRKKGFRSLYSRIWHSHVASCRVSEKAGWRNMALVLEFHPLGIRRKVEFVRRL